MSAGRMQGLLFVGGASVLILAFLLMSIVPQCASILRAIATIGASLLFGAIGIVSIWRAEFAFIVILRGRIAQAAGAVNVVLWWTIAAMALFRLIRT